MNDEPNVGRVPTFDDVGAAAARLAGVARRTPLLAGTPLDDLAGGRVLLKVESLQHTGSFKIRGAYNRLVQLGPQERAAGVVAFSSGNHAQGVAAAARMLGIHAAIVMPADAPIAKLEGTRTLGAEIILYDRDRESREAIASRLASERGATLVPAFDDPHIIAGQGTVGLELMTQAREFDATPDQVLIGCSGGGLASGSALAIRELSPNTEVLCVEPEDYDDTRRSLAAGHRVTIAPERRSICDALLSPSPGVLAFALMRRLLTGGVTVTDAEVQAAMVWAFRHLRLVVEPGGAVALAAVLAGKVVTRGRTTAIVISGGNVDPAAFLEAFRSIRV
ncbi:MAG TPA: threonine/serine dehydratase [Steroidobacteraceae bacterium]|nr:threonine/serine dehydratase [Steroidobacteraceae bacterium]